MQLLECKQGRQHGRDNHLWNYWVETHRNGIKIYSNLHIFASKYLPNSPMFCLDLECGTGVASIVLKMNKHYVVGLDYKVEGRGLRLAEVRAKEHGISTDFVQEDGYALPFKDEMFYFINCRSVIERAEQKDRFIQDMHRVLKPNGFVLVTTSNRFGYKEEHSGLLFANLISHNLCERYVKSRGRRYQDDEWDVLHPTYYSLSRSFKNLGFEILADTIDYLLDSRFTKYRMIGKCFKPARYVAPILFILKKKVE